MGIWLVLYQDGNDSPEVTKAFKSEVMACEYVKSCANDLETIFNYQKNNDHYFIFSSDEYDCRYIIQYIEIE